MSDTKESNKDMDIIEKEVAKLIKIGIKKSKKDFTKFSAMIAVLFSAGVWLLKSIWYVYQSGRMSVYGIDKCYINTDNESVFLQMIQMVSVLTVWYCVSAIYYKISISEDTTFFHWRRKVKKIRFWIIEMIVLFGIVTVMSGISIIELIEEMAGPYAIANIVLLWTICLLINMLGMVFAWGHQDAKKTNDTNENQKEECKKNKKSKYKRLSKMLVGIVVIAAASLLVIYFTSMRIEYNRSAYKVIEVQSSLDKEDKYAFEYSSESLSYELYPVVFENQDCYIVSKLYQEEDDI